MYESVDPRFLSNVPDENRDLIRQAAKETGFDIVMHERAQDNHGRSVPGYVSVWTNEPRKRNHGPFWQAYRTMLENTKGDNRC